MPNDAFSARNMFRTCRVHLSRTDRSTSSPKDRRNQSLNSGTVTDCLWAIFSEILFRSHAFLTVAETESHVWAQKDFAMWKTSSFFIRMFILNEQPVTGQTTSKRRESLLETLNGFLSRTLCSATNNLALFFVLKDGGDSMRNLNDEFRLTRVDIKRR